MGILNVTPDSFSDGGLFLDCGAAIEAGRRMMEEGADLIDVGGESTRPGAADVLAHDEIARVIPVVAALAGMGIPVSIDTMKPEVARAALAEGAQIVNDVNGLRADGMLELVSESDCGVCIMHMQGSPRTMQKSPSYGNVVSEVLEFLVGQTAFVGGLPGRVWIDPGIGFGKTVDHNLTLLRNLREFVATGIPVLVGVSRKSFIGRVTGVEDPTDRREGTLAAQVWAQIQGVRILRAHDVRASRRAIDMMTAIQG